MYKRMLGLSETSLVKNSPNSFAIKRFIPEKVFKAGRNFWAMFGCCPGLITALQEEIEDSQVS